MSLQCVLVNIEQLALREKSMWMNAYENLNFTDKG